MTFSLHRLLSTVAAATVVSLVVAGIVKHAKHGFASYLGDVAWFAFLIGVLATVALALVALVKLARDRRATRAVSR